MAGLEALVCPDDVHDRVDQRKVGEGLREVAQVAAGARVDLLGVETERAGVGEQLLAEVTAALDLADLDQRGHEPERADREGALLAGEAVVGLLDAVAQDEPVLGQLVGDRQHGRADALVIGRQEAGHHHQQHGRVQSVCVVVLAEHAPVVERVVEDVLLDLVGGGLPARRELELVAHLGKPRAAVGRDPAHQLRRGEVLGVAAHLPDPAVGVAPALERRLDLLLQDRPDPLRQVVARLGVQIDRVEQRPPDIVLLLVKGPVADPHGPRALVSGQVIERLLGQPTLTIDAVHDLENALLGLGHVGDEIEEVVCLPVKAERVQAPQHERRVADPGEPVVPVALPARGLGQRRRRGSHQCPGRGIRQPLQRQRRALQVRPPRVIRKLPVIEPVLPVMRRPHQPVIRFLIRGGRPVIRPRQRHEQRVALLHQRPPRRPRPLKADVHVRGQLQLELDALVDCLRAVVVGPGVLPLGGQAAVVEDRLAVEQHLHLAVHAPDQPQQHVVGVVIGRRPPLLVRTLVLVMPRTDQQHIADDDPAAAGAPARLEHVRPGQVAPRRRHVHIRRRQPKRPRVPVQHRPEHARRVKARQAQPLHIRVGRHQRTGLAIRQEAVLRNRRKRARADPSLSNPLAHGA